jgi:DNA-binding LacI/PurR family transcriptional regulator
MTKKSSNARIDGKGITIADVAMAAGVSIPTVSRILNNKEYVADDTRARVNEAIQKLGYVPHTQARRLRGGGSWTLALHYPVESPTLLSGVVETPYITGAAAAAGEKDYFLNFLISQLTPDTLLNMYRSNQIDGMILLQVAMDDWRVELLRANELPFVMIGRCDDLEGLTFIDLDFEHAILQAFDYLLGLGHQEIGFLTYPKGWRESGVGPAVRAFQAYGNALEAHNMSACYREIKFKDVEDGFNATNDLLNENPNITAFIAMSHASSAGSIKALTLRGRNVPEDCSVMAIGFEEFANMITPSLTAIEWSSYEISYRATHMMTEMLANKVLDARQILVAPKLVIRESTRR